MSVQLHTLSNGFRIVSEDMPGLQSASIGVWVNAGGRHERPEQNGIAHFLEHMAFKGTKNRTALEIAEVLEDVGGYLNAYTSREMTAYYARVLADDVPLALDVISDIVLNPTFDAHEIEVERGVILQEIGQAMDTPDDIIFDWLQAVSYPEQALGRTILGPSERVRSFSRADLSDFVAEYYGPGQMILAAAGAVDHDMLVKEAERRFGHLPAIRAKTPDLGVFKGGEHRRVKALEQAHFTLAFEAPGYRDDAIYTSQIYSMALGGGMSSRLFQEAREKKGLCYSIYAQAGAFAETGMLTIYSGTSGDDLPHLAELSIDEIRRSANDMSEPEVARARTQLKAGMLMGLESPSSRCERLARMVSIWGRVPTLEETVARIDAVTTDLVSGFAADMCKSTRAAMALYGPVDNAPDLDALMARLAA
ncbi:MAG: insulinase family protein [Rhodobacteraceae bacterium]|nr:insulinase family protein [Paracoccaceae bacterium]